VNYLLDSNAVIAVLKNQPALVRQRLRHAASDGGAIAVSTVVLFELWYGVAWSRHRRENAERLRVFLSGLIDIMPFEEKDAAIAGDLRAALEAGGRPIGPCDLLIAAQALRTGATLVTSNVAEFARVEGLRWLDWAAER
jgi:tRNA(fMet)-specific endonuclease VapC